MLTVLAHQAALQLQYAVVQEALARLQVCFKRCLRVTVPHLQIVCMNKKFSFLSDIFLDCSLTMNHQWIPGFSKLYENDK